MINGALHQIDALCVPCKRMNPKQHFEGGTEAVLCYSGLLHFCAAIECCATRKNKSRSRSQKQQMILPEMRMAGCREHPFDYLYGSIYRHGFRHRLPAGQKLRGHCALLYLVQIYLLRFVSVGFLFVLCHAFLSECAVIDVCLNLSIPIVHAPTITFPKRQSQTHTKIDCFPHAHNQFL